MASISTSKRWIAVPMSRQDFDRLFGRGQAAVVAWCERHTPAQVGNKRGTGEIQWTLPGVPVVTSNGRRRDVPRVVQRFARRAWALTQG